MRILKDFGASFGSALLITVFTTVGGILSARLLGPSGRGALTAALLWPSTLAALGNLGLIESMTYFSARRTSDSREVLSSGLAIAAALSVAVMIIGYFAFPYILGKYGNEEIRTARWCLAFVPLNLLALALSAHVLGTGRIVAYSFARSAVHVATVLAMIALFATNHASVRTFAFAAVFANGISFTYWIVLSKSDLVRLPAVRWRTVIELMIYGIKVHLGVLASLMNLRLDQLLMSVLVAPEALGFYVVGVAIAGVVNLPASAMIMATFPRIAGALDRDEQVRMFGQATRIAVSMCGAIALVFVIGAPYLIRVLFGAAYLPAVGPSRILIAAAIPLALVMQIEAGLKALNHPEVPSYGEAIGLVITGISLAVLLPRLGTMGAAIASLLGYSSTAAFLALLLKTRTGLSGWTLLHPRATDWEAAVALYRQFRMAVQVPVSEM